MADNDQALKGFAATLHAVETLEDPRTALPLLGAALREARPVRRAALRFLLALPGIDAAVAVVRGFADLDSDERAEALADRGRLAAAAEAVLGDKTGTGRQGLASFTAALPSVDGLRFLLHLIDDPAETVRRTARESLLRTARGYAEGTLPLPALADLRRLTAAAEIVLRTASQGEATDLAAALFRAAADCPEAQTALRAQALRPEGAARSAVIKALSWSRSPAAAAILLDMAAARVASAAETALPILRRRQEPEFLRALAEEANRRMESPAGIPATAVAVLAQVAWEAMPRTDLERLSAAAQKRLLAICRTFRGDLPVRARRIAAFLKSNDRRIRETTLDALGEYPPNTYKDDLPALLEDPAEEIQLRAAELLARAGTSDSRRRLQEKASHASDRVRRFILGRLASIRFPGAIPAAEEPKPATAPQRRMEESTSPVLRHSGLANVGGRS